MWINEIKTKTKSHHIQINHPFYSSVCPSNNIAFLHFCVDRQPLGSYTKFLRFLSRQSSCVSDKGTLCKIFQCNFAPLNNLISPTLQCICWYNSLGYQQVLFISQLSISCPFNLASIRCLASRPSMELTPSKTAR